MPTAYSTDGMSYIMHKIEHVWGWVDPYTVMSNLNKFEYFWWKRFSVQKVQPEQVWICLGCCTVETRILYGGNRSLNGQTDTHMAENLTFATPLPGDFILK